jgi:poly-gamma-glutamate capsule biosynthesis protein CapA/YwtB (metallophosphatase superfamily)
MTQHRWHEVLLALPILLGVGIAWHYVLQTSQPVVVQTPAKDNYSTATRLLFVGDVFWGRQIQSKAQSSPLRTQYLTSGLDQQDRSNYDAWIANFECPITEHDVPYSLQVSSLKFNCRPEYLPELSKWFTAVTLANNHMDNNGGQDGQLQTRQNLEKNGIQYAGTYDMSQTADICEVLSLPALSGPSHKKTHMPVALCGYMYVVDAQPTDLELAQMEQYARVMPVIAMPHMGIEYRTTAEPEKVDAYRRMIDNGADIVIGAHPHVIQNSESWRGKLIAYSLGNFLFDQQSLGRATTLGLGVGVQLTVSDSKAARLYNAVAADCASYKDSCLEKLLANSPIGRPRISVKYSFTCYDEAQGVPTQGSTAACTEAQNLATTDKLAHLNKQW